MNISNGFCSWGDEQCLVRIDGLELDASIGIYPHEKAKRQTIVVDLAWLLSSKTIVRADNICKTIDYDDVASCINTLLANQHFNLLETLTQRMIETLQSTFLFERLKLTVHKPAAIPAARSVSITRIAGVHPMRLAELSVLFESGTA